MCVCVRVRVCVCVCVCACVWTTCLPGYLREFFKRIAGGQPREHSWLPNEEGYATADIGSDQPSVPASLFASVVQVIMARG